LEATTAYVPLCSILISGVLRILPDLAPFESHDDDRFAAQCAALDAIGRFIQFDLFAGSVVRARFVLATQSHIEALLLKSVRSSKLSPRPKVSSLS
jgi:hypothetical protein